MQHAPRSHRRATRATRRRRPATARLQPAFVFYRPSREAGTPGVGPVVAVLASHDFDLAMLLLDTLHTMTPGRALALMPLAVAPEALRQAAAEAVLTGRLL